MSLIVAGNANTDLLPQTSVTLPKNAVEVYAEIYASGNGDEEFWVTFPDYAVDQTF